MARGARAGCCALSVDSGAPPAPETSPAPPVVIWAQIAPGSNAAAIPAVIFYNKLSADADRILSGYESFADEFATILSRQLDS